MLSLDSEWPNDGVRSISTPDIVHKKPSAYLAEVMFLNKTPGLKEYPYFWRVKEHQNSYSGYIINLEKRLNTCGFKPLHNAIVKHKLSSFDPNTDECIVKEITSST
jgi:hypothetical protein